MVLTGLFPILLLGLIFTGHYILAILSLLLCFVPVLVPGFTKVMLDQESFKTKHAIKQQRAKNNA
jgi:hypothetical protein